MAGDLVVASRGQAWFCTTGLPSDLVVEVDGMSYHLHKIPLISKSRKLGELLSGQERVEEEEEENEENKIQRISLNDFPGVSQTFETAAKFCYGVKIELSSTTVIPLRCAAEYLEMTEDFDRDNLVARTEQYLDQSVFRSLPKSVKALKTCESLLPHAEELGLTKKCIDVIAARACSTEVSSLFSWPVNDAGDHHRFASWMEDLTILNLPFYKRVLAAMMEKNPSSELIEGSLASYARKHIPGLSRSKRNLTAAAPPSEQEQLELLETVITNLSLAKSSVFISTQFLFGLLRTANILHAPESLKTTLEKKIAKQLDQATLDDLLMPSYSYLTETLYDVEVIERILRFYNEASSVSITGDGERSPERNGDPFLKLGRLLDGYLAEVASDTNLPANKFCSIALTLPEHARLYDDGLYRAIDVYLKAHPGITEEEKEKVSGVMDCRKLTLEACTHAAQNERLPLRAVVQVLFFEQLQLRQAIAGTILPAGEEVPRPVNGGTWRAAAQENQLLRLGLDSMRNRVQDLERECSSMRRAIEKIDRKGTARALRRPPDGGWGSLTRKLGCKSRIQVCDSQAAGPKRSDAEQSH